MAGKVVQVVHVLINPFLPSQVVLSLSPLSWLGGQDNRIPSYTQCSHYSKVFSSSEVLSYPKSLPSSLADPVQQREVENLLRHRDQLTCVPALVSANCKTGVTSICKTSTQEREQCSLSLSLSISPCTLSRYSLMLSLGGGARGQELNPTAYYGLALVAVAFIGWAAQLSVFRKKI